jgi:soluble lytic murein transglycosylase-like protein
MHPSPRRPTTAWQYGVEYRRHPTGRTRRRWPRAYDGGEPEPRLNPRYSLDYERDRPLVDRRRTPRGRSVMDDLRQSPLRNGLIGLAVAGTAAPIAINRYQQAMRTDPSHENVVARMSPIAPVSDAAVTNTWKSMETAHSDASAEREAVITQKMAENESFGLSRELAEDIYDMAVEADVDFDVAYGLVRAESSFKDAATSRVGAVGLTQLMPATARWLEPGTTRDDLRNPETNLRIGFGYLRQLIDKYDGNADLALTAYNRGPGTVDKILKRGGNPDNGYANFVRSGKVGNHKG